MDLLLNMSYELTGTVKVIFDEQTFASGFNKREFVVTSEADKFPQDVKFECLKDKVDLVSKLNKGDKVKVSFDINGREWNEKYYVNLVAWRIEGAAAGGAADDEPPPTTLPTRFSTRNLPSKSKQFILQTPRVHRGVF